MRNPAPILLLASLLLAGCSAGSTPESVGTTESAPATETIAASPVEEPPTEFVPKFHTHDYWGGRESMILFEGRVEIGQDLLAETTLTSSAVIIGSTTFDTKSDGEDVNTADKTDVVFQGTEHIEVTVRWADANTIPGLNFYYKPANTPTFTLLGPMETGNAQNVYLRQGMADMPHQLSLSRWKFRLEAFNPQTASFPIKAFHAKGSVEVSILIYNGGERFIDPPHPYFFLGGPNRYAGEVNQTLSNCLFVNNTRVSPQQPQTSPLSYGCRLDGFRVDPPNIVPWETTKLVVDLWYNYTGSASGTAPHALGLKVSASDSPEYRYPAAVESKAGYARYELTVTEPMTDSPYATQSDWRYGVYPIVADQRDYGGDFSGNIHVLATAVNEGAPGRGMGN